MQILNIYNYFFKFLFRSWAKTGFAYGYLYQVGETWGKKLNKKPLDARLFNGCKVRCDLQNQIQRHIYYYGAYEPVESYLFSKLVKPGMVVVDIGANVGNYTLIAAHAVESRGKVYAFEPVTSNFDILSKHVAINDFENVVTLEKLGVWHQTQVLSFSVYDETGIKDNATNYTVGNYGDSKDSQEFLCVSLDEYFEEKHIKNIDTIKMDIEGAEYFALQGAKKTIQKYAPTILMEINRQACHLVGYEADLIADFFHELDYEMWSIGISANNSHILPDLHGVERTNILCYPKSLKLPKDITSEWDIKSILRCNFHS